MFTFFVRGGTAGPEATWAPYNSGLGCSKKGPHSPRPPGERGPVPVRGDLEGEKKSETSRIPFVPKAGGGMNGTFVCVPHVTQRSQRKKPGEGNILCAYRFLNGPPPDPDPENMGLVRGPESQKKRGRPTQGLPPGSLKFRDVPPPPVGPKLGQNPSA